MNIYVASSFRHVHAVRLLGRELRSMGYTVLDWTEKATPPEGLNPAQRREWMDTDHGGEVFVFCAKACKEADFLIYLGSSGQDAGVEVGIAHGSGVPVLAIRGPLEAPGLMLYGAGTVWVDSIEAALELLAEIQRFSKKWQESKASEQYGHVHVANLKPNIVKLLSKCYPELPEHLL